MQRDLGGLGAFCTFLPSITGASSGSEVPKLVKHRALVQANPVAEGRAACHSHRLYVSRHHRPAKAPAMNEAPIVISAHKLQSQRGGRGERT